ncbi:MAG: GTPase HflX [Acidobacteriota bacterium]
MSGNVDGQLTGLGRHQRKRVEALTRRRLSPDRLLSQALARELTELSRELGRVLGLVIDRAGRVELALVGDDTEVEIPVLGRGRAGPGRLLGLRLIRTSFLDVALSRDDLTDLELLRLDYLVTIAVKDDGLPGKVRAAHLLPPGPSGKLHEQLEYREPTQVHLDALATVQALEDEWARVISARHEVADGEATLLVMLRLPKDADFEDRKRELKELARTADLNVLEVVAQSRPRADPRTLLGSGKLREVMLASKQLGVDLVVFDRELSGSQVRNVAELTDQRVIDRSQLILDIFARHAKSREGKLQVELAQLRYLLPRLAGKGTALSRLAGGIGARGPGESKLEMDRRRIRTRIQRVEKQLSQAASSLRQRGALRRRRGLPVVSIVGYTNAGKSTLLNRMTRSDEIAEDKLFATLDTRSRRLRLPREREVLVTDTVGFIRDLPEQLRRAFRSTLEELRDADLLLHVVDASSSRALEQMKTVESLLDELELSSVPVVVACNKADREPELVADLAAECGGLPISAVSGEGLDELGELLCERLVQAGAWQPGQGLDPGLAPWEQAAADAEETDEEA